MSPRNIQFGREEIIDAAFQLVREQGWSGFSVQAVAKAINASTMPIYSQFSNVRDLEDAVCLKALELLKERLLEERTGDKWIDQGISYIRFAEEEKYLFRCMWDGRNVELCKKMGKELVDFISATLVDYPLFAGLDELELKMIRLSRMMFAQKLAYWLNTNSNYLAEKGLDTEDFIRRTSKAIYDGFMLQFNANADGADAVSGG
ncbi:TetR/AcrR family transcriptional regulator [Geotalea uraniireducens]|uniref:Transcriptional regulator, TetR family n=1 Tax=Geotalea uraniireducens (strain Rf4) TaxID=351605 RepID=A5GAK6_GEOUR|nr:TetR/AcrR family transcriptional regulator [Geotalea uraniireducens]ABQ25394.1 transcriptional regulator, TetR family [Geotalea uraniireducens Rf4]